MFRYLLAVIGTGIGIGLLFNETRTHRKTVDRKKRLLKNVYKSDKNIDNIDEWIYEHNFSENSLCHKVILETYKVHDEDLQLNGKLSFIHIQSSDLKCNNNDANDLTRRSKMTEYLYNKINATKFMEETYDLKLNEYFKDYSLVKISIGQNLKKLYFYCRKFYDQRVIIS